MCLQIMHPESHYSPPSLPLTLTFKPYVIMPPLIIWTLSKHLPCFHGWPLSVYFPHSSLSSSLEEGSQTMPGPLAAHLTHRKLPARANKYCAALYRLPVWSETPLLSLIHSSPATLASLLRETSVPFPPHLHPGCFLCLEHSALWPVLMAPSFASQVMVQVSHW